MTKTRQEPVGVPVGQEEGEGLAGAEEGWCAGVFG